MQAAVFETILQEVIPFAAFVLTCAALLEVRLEKRAVMRVLFLTMAGIFTIQAAMFCTGQDLEMIRGTQAFTVYLPAVACVHYLSANGYFQTCTVWIMGDVVSFTVEALQKILLKVNIGISGWRESFVFMGVSILGAAALVTVVFRMLRKPFRSYVSEHRTWLGLLFPTIMVLLLFSYFINSTTNPVVLTLVCMTGVSVILLLAYTVVLSVSARRIQETEQTVSQQLELQRRDYEAALQKLDQGRSYRHDMRHHLVALDGLLQSGDQEGARAYISSLSGQLKEIEPESYCKNIAVNAVLSAYIGQAKEAGCTVSAHLNIPEETFFDDMELCVIFANALENAVRACRAVPAGEHRRIAVSAETTHRRLSVSVRNSCSCQVKFDEAGFPAVPERESHGFGLKSIEAITKKYNGIFQCGQEDGDFILRAVLFSSPEDGLPKEKGGAQRAAATVPC